MTTFPTSATPADRTAHGRAARAAVPRSAHAHLPGADRDPVAILQRQAESRLPELLPIRYGRMTASPFAYFRGAALVMAGDLARTPVSGITAQLSGDAHLSNFGIFGTPERRLVFDLNDFDETLRGPWEWDVKRLAASLAVAGRDNGLGPADRAAVIRAAVESYRVAMREYAEMGTLELWYAHLDVDAAYAQLGPTTTRGHRRLGKSLTRARTRNSAQAMAKMTRLDGGERRIVADPPLVVPLRELLSGADREGQEQLLSRLIAEYGESLPPDRRHLLEQYRIVDVARKVVGVGSVGVRTWVVLLTGRDDQDPLFLQAKEATPSVLAAYAGPSPYPHEGERVVAGQRLMQAASDIFLGWHRLTEDDGITRDFYVRQLRDWKGSADIAAMNVAELAWYGDLCGATLARAHARSGDRIAIAAYLGPGDAFDRAVTGFAEAYADRNERDFAALRAAVQTGRVAAHTGL